MPEDKLSLASQLQYSGIWGYVCMIGLACWGGAVKYAKAVRNGEKPKLINFLFELFVSGFCGLMASFVCVYFGLDVIESSIFIGMAGYSGTSFLDKLKATSEAKISKTDE